MMCISARSGGLPASMAATNFGSRSPKVAQSSSTSTPRSLAQASIWRPRTSLALVTKLLKSQTRSFVFGWGRMAGPMARNLAKAGYELHVFDVDPAAARRAAAPGGVTVHARPREVAARASVVFTALPNDAIVTATYLGPEGILAGGQRGLVTCDCSTVSPEVSQTIHDAARRRGVAHMDTPMLGSAPQAEPGERLFTVGGDRGRPSAAEP